MATIIVKKLVSILTVAERRRLAVVFAIIVFAAVLDASGVASILPFIAVLANPELIQSNRILAYFYDLFGFVSVNQYLIFLGLLVLIFLLTSSVIRAINVYTVLRYTQMREYAIGSRVLECYLCQPYTWFLSRHTGDLASGILSEVNTVVTQAIFPLLILISQGVAAAALLIVMLFFKPKITIVVVSFVGGIYLLLYLATKKHLRDIGKSASKANALRFTAVSEALGAIKEVKSSNAEKLYLKRFALQAETYAHHQATAKAFAQLPRFAMEAIGFGGLVAILIYMVATQGELSKALPTIAFFAFAGYRLMPACQQMYGAASQIRFSGSALEKVSHDLTALTKRPPAHPNQRLDAVRLNHYLALNNVSFRYPNSDRDVLKSFNIRIPALTSVGFVGPTGSGKSTAVDVILGLLEPQSGGLIVDGVEINEINKSQWQSQIGYVPQHIFLLDDTIAANIAFGVEEPLIDYDKIKNVARIANLHEFVTGQLPDGYQTKVGERGVRLSGGQRQRIGIARALYREPALLIFDESTSALDNVTEQVVMEALRNLQRKVTIILIAHRLTTVSHCDSIYYINQGSIEAQGSYAYLERTHAGFRKLALSQ